MFEQNPCLYQINGEPQGEAICWDSAGSGLYMVSEAHHTTEPIWCYLIAGKPSGEQVTLVEADSIWKYLDNGPDQGTVWRDMLFDDGAWASGAAELGCGDGDEATTVSYGSNGNNKHLTTYFRRTFGVVEACSCTGLDISLNLRLIGTRPEAPSHGLRVRVVGRGETDPAVGSHVYSEGTDVSVYAYPSASLDYYFEGWIGDHVPSGLELDNPLVITVDSSKAIIAVFFGEGEAIPWAFLLLPGK
jgi:hypothetical protein